MRQRIIKVALIGAVAAVVTVPRPARADDRDSIYDVDPVIDGAVIAGSVSLVIGLYAFGAGAIDTRCPCDPQEVNPLDRFAVDYHSGAAAWASNATAGVALLAPPLLDWLALGATRPLLEDLTVYSEALAVGGALVTTVKQLVQRPFPRTYQGDPTLVDSANGYRSFFSGHATLVFAALSTASITFRERHGPSWVPWAITAAFGTAVAVGRVAAGWHFPTDVMAGTAAGLTIGVVVPLLHLHRLRLSPFVSTMPGSGAAGLSLGGRWS